LIVAAATLLDLLPAALSAHLIPARRLEEEGGDKRGVVATALPRLDALLGGGWPRGVVSELAGPRSSGKTSILYASLAGALKSGGAAALVDAEQAFDARLAARAGVPLARLLWVHAPGTHALRAAELLIDAGGFDLVAVDIGDKSPRLPDAAWVRLRHGAERQRTVALVVAASPLVHSFASVAVILSRQGVDFGERQDSRRSVLVCSAAPPLLTGLRSNVVLSRGRTPADGADHFSIEFSVMAPLPDNDAAPPDRDQPQSRRKT